METVGAAMLHEQPDLLPLVPEPFELAETSFPTVDGLRCVRVRTNRYPIPLPPGTKVERGCERTSSSYGMKEPAWRGTNAATAASSRSSIWNSISMCCARSLGALAGSTPLAQWRQAGRSPECFDQLWQALILRHGRQPGTRQMIELLSLGTEEGWDRLRVAVEQSLSLGCHDVAAIRHLLVAGLLTKPTVEAIEIGMLSRYDRPQPVLSGYDQLLAEVLA